MPDSVAADVFTQVSVQQALREGGRVLAEHDPVDCGVDARRLLIFVLGCDALELVTNPARRLTAGEAEQFAAVLTRRRAGEPVSRITGWRGFYGREFAITTATLDPRPDTETLVDASLRLTRERFPDGDGLEILDIGTGSGCLLVTLLAELPGARGVGVDISAAALVVAAENAERLGVADRCTWVEGRTFAGMEWRFGLVVSNPPYIPTGDIGQLAREVRQFDPMAALDGGRDGLDIYREIAAGTATHIGEGWLVLEAGDTQAEEIEAILWNSIPPQRLVWVETYADMASMQRCVAAGIQN